MGDGLLLLDGAEVEDVVFVGPDDGDLSVVQIDDRACVGEDRRGVGRDEILVVADRHEERRAEPRRHDRVGLAGRDDGDAVRALDLCEPAGDGLNQRASLEV